MAAGRYPNLGSALKGLLIETDWKAKLISANNSEPTLSVVVPAYNSGWSLEPCLKAIRGSTIAPLELIVVDDGSVDGTRTIARQFADRVISLEHRGQNAARMAGFRAAKGSVIVNVDSDIVIGPDALAQVISAFREEADLSALTGILSRENTDRGFFSQYKNFHLHWLYSQLPEQITFLYGSFFAFRCGLQPYFESRLKSADDTDAGQRLSAHNKKIVLRKSLAVTHLKRYHLLSLLRNDLRMGYEWSKIFLERKPWQRLGQNSTAILHCLRHFVSPHFLFSFARKEGTIRGLLAALFSLLDSLFLSFGILVSFIQSAVQFLISCLNVASIARIKGCTLPLEGANDS